MKFKIEIECTPEEARGLLGMPDLTVFQDAMSDGLKDKIKESVAGLDPEALMKMWMPAGSQGLEAMQKAFWEGLSGDKFGSGRKK